jgi:hypothetical protein
MHAWRTVETSATGVLKPMHDLHQYGQPKQTTITAQKDEIAQSMPLLYFISSHATRLVGMSACLQRMRTHVGPRLIDVREARLFRPLLSRRGPTIWHDLIYRPNRILPFPVDDDPIIDFFLDGRHAYLSQDETKSTLFFKSYK